jgi:ribosomal protein S27AE
MWTKQSQSFCPACGETTHQATHFYKDDAGTLVARAPCAECPQQGVPAETTCLPRRGNPTAFR